MITHWQVKYIQSLHEKKQRDEAGVFVAEGTKIINELLAAPQFPVVQLYAIESWVQRHVSIHQHCSLVTVTKSMLSRISFLSTPHEVLGIFKQPADELLTPASKGLVLMLDDVQDPGNVGTILRTADWFGITNIVCSLQTADAYAPKVVQASMGSIARVQVKYTVLNDYLLQHTDVPVYVTSLEGTAVQEMEKIKSGILVIGNEAKGVSDAILTKAHQKITIKKLGKAESLNAAVAAGIVLSYVV
jgi:RNA methyltransferase, TrmH family